MIGLRLLSMLVGASAIRRLASAMATGAQDTLPDHAGRAKGRTFIAVALPESVKNVLEDKAYGHVVTFDPNGRPQVTMVWMDVEGNGEG
jgi:hypothetical protein